jgi:hypothetical protein
LTTNDSTTLYHNCKVPPKAEHGQYGYAVMYCVENEVGELWVDNDEYQSQVNYCPFCGYKAAKQI